MAETVVHDSLHPKVVGGLLGAGAGGVVGLVATVVLSHVSQVVAIPEAYQSILYAGVVFLLTTIGHFVFAYLSKWSVPAVADVSEAAGVVVHDVDHTQLAADVSARVASELGSHLKTLEDKAESLFFGSSSSAAPSSAAPVEIAAPPAEQTPVVVAEPEPVVEPIVDEAPVETSEPAVEPAQPAVIVPPEDFVPEHQTA